MKHERIQEPLLLEDNYYFVRFLDHNLKTRFGGVIGNEYFQFVGKFLQDTDNFHNFVLTECSQFEDSDIFQIVKGSIIKLEIVEIND